MLRWFIKSNDTALAARRIYGAVVAQSRAPHFYADIGIPDTPEGRLEMLIMHLFLVAEALRATGSEGEHLIRALIESFVTDMDDCMREMGVGDLTVPKRVRKAAETFYSRSGSYRAALANVEPRHALKVYMQEALEIGEPFDADTLAVYVMAQHRYLHEHKQEKLRTGTVTFLAAETI